MLETRVTDMIMDFRNRVFSEGVAEGEAIGEARGRLETALNFLAMGLDPAAVAKGTGLPLAEVERLAAETR